MPKLHIMHILGTFAPGGAEMGVVRLIQSFPDKSIKHSVCSVGPDMTMQKYLPEGTGCYSLDITSPCRTAFLKFRDLFLKKHVDIVHVNNIPPWFDAAVGARISCCKCIQTFHGVEDSRLEYSILKKLQILCAWKCSDYINAVSQASAEFFSQLTGIDKKHVNIITNGVDTDFFRPVNLETRASLKNQLGLPKNKKIIGCVAALRPVKNHKGLLDAFALLLKESSEYCLVLVGEGPLETGLKHYCRELNIQESVIFAGHQHDTVKYLNAFDLFVLNSTTEGLSYALLEAMATGLPVVATNVGGNIQLIEDGKDGFLIQEGNTQELYNTLSQLCHARELIEVIGRNARKKIVAHYSLESSLQKYLEMYVRLSEKGHF